MTTTEKRVSRLEGAYKHFATKADVIGADVRADVQELRGEIRAMETRLLLRPGC